MLKTSLNGKPDMWPHMLALNVLQSYYEYSSDPRVLPLIITEGSKKVDALISAGAGAVVGLVGVWNWRGRRLLSRQDSLDAYLGSAAS